MVVHVRIPTSSKIVDANGTSTVYHIYLNGTFHCSARYSRLAELDSLLRKNVNSTPSSSLRSAKSIFNGSHCTSNALFVPPHIAAAFPPFPPRKFPLLQMSESETDERRRQLENYLQFVCSVDEIVSSTLFSRFLISLQLETHQIPLESVEIEINFVNDSRLKLATTSDCSPLDVMIRVCSEIHLPIELAHFFGLFVVLDNSSTRRLLDCESAYVASGTSSASRLPKLLFRRDYYHAKLDEVLVTDQTAVNLLFIEAVMSWRNGTTEPTEAQTHELESLKQSNLRSDFLHTIRSVPHYGTVLFRDCKVTYKKILFEKCSIRVGNGFVIVTSPPTQVFSLKQIACWQVRYAGLEQPGAMNNGHHNGVEPSSCDELAFQYRDSSSTSEWVKIYSPQASLIGHCLGRLMDDCLRVRSLFAPASNASSVAALNGNGEHRQQAAPITSRSNSATSSTSSSLVQQNGLDASTASFAAMKNGVNNDGHHVTTSLNSSMSLSRSSNNDNGNGNSNFPSIRLSTVAAALIGNGNGYDKNADVIGDDDL